jgi:hypothetical protein
MQIVGLSGYAQSGKDTAADALVSIGFVRIAFADKLREFLYQLNPLLEKTNDGDQLATITYTRLRTVIDDAGWEGYKTSYWGPEIRQMIQSVGTECVRDILGQDTWVNATLNNLDSSERYVITDVRFPNEVDAIRHKMGKIIRIIRPGIKPSNNHISDTALDDYYNAADYLVYNRTTVEEFHGDIINAAHWLNF